MVTPLEALRKLEQEARAGLIGKEPAGPTTWEPPLPFHDTKGPPFPEGVFPAKIEQFARAQATALQVPFDLVGILTLGVAAAACSGRAQVYLGPEWSEPLNEYYLVALPSGERKSETFRRITDPLEERERELVEARRPEIDQAAVEREIKEKRLQELKSKAAKAHGDEAEQLRSEAVDLSRELGEYPIPSLPRLIADDATPEAVTTLLCEQDGRFAVMSTEGGIFDTMAGRYSDGITNIDIFMKAYTGDPVRVDRKYRAAEHIPRPLLTLCLTVQPQVIEDLNVHREFRGRGLLARFKYSIPKSLVGYRKTKVPGVPDELRRMWTTVINPHFPDQPRGCVVIR